MKCSIRIYHTFWINLQRTYVIHTYVLFLCPCKLRYSLNATLRPLLEDGRLMSHNLSFVIMRINYNQTCHTTYLLRSVTVHRSVCSKVKCYSVLVPTPVVVFH